MSHAPVPDLSRRDFLQTLTGVAAWAAAGVPQTAAAESRVATSASTPPRPALPAAATNRASGPWFRRCVRWGQTNLTEVDPARFDTAWWRRHWKRTHVQGVVINAGGIVAYYPTQVPLHRRARDLGDRDLFGELCRAAHDDGLAVFARMDSNRADAAFFREHPDWFARDAAGQPYLVTGLPVACVNSPYYDEHIPAILREVATLYRPDGFTDNNWNGPMRHQPCFCQNCQRKFRERTGAEVPRAADWNDALYREWILWNYERRLEIWDQFNRVTRGAGGPDCLWVGMMAGSQNWQARVFRDDREVYRRSELIMLDHQRRFDEEGFQHNAETGKRLHSVGGWDKIIPESMAMYHLTEHNYRLAAKPEPEVRLWAVEAFAGGIQPWWHHVGSDQQDRRMLKTATPLMTWHRDNEAYLLDRVPVATVGLVWSQRNMDFFGRDDGSALVDQPWNGFTQAMVRARIPYVPVHIDDVERVAEELNLRLLILPNLAAMSDKQADDLRRFAARGGSLFATGLSSLCNEWGEARADFALAELFGAHLPEGHSGRDDRKRAELARKWSQTYLRLHPELRAGVDGPTSGSEPPVAGVRHAVLNGFAETDILAFGGELEPLRVEADAEVLLTYVPPVPVSPAESIWMPEPNTEVPGLVLKSHAGGGRCVYLPADLDRRFAREDLPDHAMLLANLVRWAVGEPLPLQVEGTGLLDCQLYRQPGRLILHVVNLTNPNAWRTPVHELVPVGPFTVAVALPKGAALRSARSLVSGGVVAARQAGDRAVFTLERIADHDVLVLELTG